MWRSSRTAALSLLGASKVSDVGATLLQLLGPPGFNHFSTTPTLQSEALLKGVTRRREWEKSVRSAVSDKKDAHEDGLQATHDRVYTEGRYIAVDDAFPLGDASNFKDMPAADKQARISPPPEADHHVTRVAIVGPPNAGKSSLMNSLCSTRVSASADREGVTKDWVKGVITIHNTQLVFLDTPGIFKVDKGRTKHQNTHHTHAAWDALMGADVCLLAYPIGLGYLPAEDKGMLREVLFKCSKREMPVLLCMTKSDLLKGSSSRKSRTTALTANTLYKELRADLDSSGLGSQFAKIIELSSTHFTGQLELKDLLCQYAKPKPWKYFPQQKCAMTDAQRVQELITEKIFKYLPGDVPHRCKVRVIGWTPTSIVHTSAQVVGSSTSSIVQGSGQQNSILVDTEVFFERPTFTAVFLQKKLAITQELKVECQAIFKKRFVFKFHNFITPGGIR